MRKSVDMTRNLESVSVTEIILDGVGVAFDKNIHNRAQNHYILF